MLRVLVGLVLAATIFGTGSVQAYPDRPIRIVVGFAAGGPADTSARIAAQILEAALGTSVIVENRTGAGGRLATDFVANAAADGHTLLLSAFADILGPIINKDSAPKLEDRFVQVAMITGVANMLVVHPSVPVKTAAEFVALAKQRPGAFNYGSAGVGSASHLAGALLAGLAGIDIIHVPYKGTAQAQLDLLAGRLPFMFDSMVSARENVAAGKLHALAVTTNTRSPAAPDLPTMAEAGVAEYDLTSWFGLSAPKGTPDAVVKRISDAIRAGLKNEQVRAALLKFGGEPADLSPQEFTTFVKAEGRRWQELFDKSTVRLQ
jgi:tripartite-type tricarboxylate transporter receptor subunit TctC